MVSPRFRAWTIRGFCLFIGLLIGLILAEVFLRGYFAIVPSPSDSPYLAHKDADFIRRPTNHGDDLIHADDHINTLGFRDREHEFSKTERVFRILGVGDSFVFSLVPLDDNFLRVIEREISFSPPCNYREVEMILMGMGAWSPENELGALKGIGLNLEPDLVLLNFFVGNDVTDIPLKGKVLRGRLYYVGSPYPLLNLLRKSMVYLLLERNMLYCLRDRLITRQVDAKVETTPDLIIPDEPDLDATIPAHYLHHQMKRLQVYEVGPSRRIEKLWRRAEAALVQISELCREEGTPLVLHLIPAEIQVDGHARSRVLEALGHSAESYDFDYPQRRLREFASRNGIRVFDSLPLMRKEHDPAEPLYIQFDTHWNTRGNHVAGKALADSISVWMNDSKN